MKTNKFPCAVPDGISGNWRVETFEVSKKHADFSRIRAMFRPLEAIEAGTYKRLMRGDTVVMSNTPMELDTNSAIIRSARGRVLINGLGLGLVLSAILKKKEVEHVTIIEKSADVIKLVAPSFAKERVTIIQADALEYRPAKGARFDRVWHDIWDFICGDNLPQMNKLRRRYAKHTDWQACWCHRECLRG
jgi:spermidine synthase